MCCTMLPPFTLATWRCMFPEYLLPATQAQLQLAAQMQANEVAQAAAAQDPAAAQAAAMTHLRTLPQQQRMQV